MAKITVYGTPTCPYCIRAKEFFKENNLEFENHDVSQDKVRLDEMVDKTGQMGVPVIGIDDEFIVGFDKEKISSLLGI